MSNVSDDKLVEKFLMQGRIEVPDSGFSRRVMRRLPGRLVWFNRIWTAVCAAAMFVLILKSNIFEWFGGTLRGFMSDVSTHEMILGNPFIAVILVTLTVSALSATVILKELR